jgi:amphi-Trp domain-containing protein
MADVEIKRKTRLTRKAAGERLIALGTKLVESSVSELEFDGDSIKFAVADHVEWEFELEVDGDEVELEIELKWSDPAPAAPADTPKRAPAKRRSSGAG